MQIEPTHETEVICKDLIGELYKAARAAGGWFSGINQGWAKVEEALARKGALDVCTTKAEDNKAQDILEEVFEEASQAALKDGHIDFASGYVNYKQLWERVCAVIGVQV